MVNIMLLAIILDEGYDRKVNLLLNRYGIKVKTEKGLFYATRSLKQLLFIKNNHDDLPHCYYITYVFGTMIMKQSYGLE